MNATLERLTPVTMIAAVLAAGFIAVQPAHTADRAVRAVQRPTVAGAAQRPAPLRPDRSPDAHWAV